LASDRSKDSDSEGPEGAPHWSVLWQGTYPPEDVAVRRSRLDVGNALGQTGLARVVIDDVLAVLTEIVGNAVRHARTECIVTASLHAGVLRVEVFDGDTHPPSLLGLDADSTSGRGLHLVTGIARDWGWRPAVSDDGVAGKRVWAELDDRGA